MPAMKRLFSPFNNLHNDAKWDTPGTFLKYILSFFKKQIKNKSKRKTSSVKYLTANVSQLHIL